MHPNHIRTIARIIREERFSELAIPQIAADLEKLADVIQVSAIDPAWADMVKRLTDTDRAVLGMLGRGAHRKDMMNRLDVDGPRLTTMCAALFRKLGVNNQAGAAALAVKAGLA